MIGTWYKKDSTVDNTSIFLDKSRVAYLYAYLARVVKFTITLPRHVLKGKSGNPMHMMSSKTLECLQSILVD